MIRSVNNFLVKSRQYLSISGFSSLIHKLLFFNDHDNQQHQYKAETSHGRWDDIPKEILEMITTRLDLMDQIRFRLVCKYWRSLVTGNGIQLKRQLPWLLLPQGADGEDCLVFFSPSEDKLHKLSLPEFAVGGWCCGASKGWLLLARETQLAPEVFLFNPFSRAKFSLPSFATISSFRNFVSTIEKPYNVSCFVNQIALSSSDMSNCIVAAILDEHKVLAVSRPKDERWTIIKEEDRYICNYLSIVFFEEGLYDVSFIEEDLNDVHIREFDRGFLERAISKNSANENKDKIDREADIREEQGDHQVNDLHENLDKEDSDHEDLEVQGEVVIEEGSAWIPYLVETSKNESLLINKTYDTNNYEYYDKEDNAYFATNEYTVHKIDMKTPRLIEVKNLEEVVFLTGGGSLSISSSDFNGTIRGNCVYFVEDCDCGGDDHLPFMSRENGVF